MRKARPTRKSAPPTRHWPTFWACRRMTCTTRRPRPAHRRCPAPSGRTASAATRNCSRTAPPGRAILPMKNTAKKWRNRPMRTPCAITINRPDQSYRKSRSALPWRKTFRRYCKSARTAASSTLHEQALTKANFPPLNRDWKP